MKRLFLQVVLLIVTLLAGFGQLNAQCTGLMAVTVQGSGTGLALTASETHINAVCPADNGSATISATGGTTPYTGTGTFSQPVGTQSYTVIDFLGCVSMVSVMITSNLRPTGVISGSTVICSGQMTTLTLTVTGTGTLSGMLSEGTIFSGTAPTILVNVSPTMSTTYTIATLSDALCSSIPADLTGSATVGVLTCTDISGKLIWEGDRFGGMTGVNGATVTLSGDASDTDVTGIPGTYSLSSTMGTNFMVTPKKNKPMPDALNGVTAADASRIQQHVSGFLLLTDPYKIIAADPNKSNSVTSADAYLVQQALLGNPIARAHFINTTWRFVPKAYVFPTPSNPFAPVFPEKINIVTSGTHIDQDFIGLKTGDVNNDANPVNKPNGPAPDLIWLVQDQALEQDATITTEFKAENFDDLLALQFGLQFDPTIIQFQDIELLPGSPMQDGNFGLYTASEGEIRALLAMALPQTLADGTPGFRLKFKVLQGGGKLSEVLQLNNEVLLGEAYSSDYTPGPVELVYDNIVTGTNEPRVANFSLLQNRPNPFKDMTVIGFIIPEDCEAQIRIFDLNGKLILEQKAWFAGGYNEQKFRLGDYVGDGVLYYELLTPYGILSKKMTLLKD